MLVTKEQFTAFTKQSDAQQLEDLNATLEQYQINTPRRIRYFMAQAYSETQGFTKFEENLYYTTAERIAVVWPTRFYSARTDGTRVGRGPLNAALYTRNPEKLSNEVYSNRMGNGPALSGDGYRYRGRGAVHLTGKANYQACSLELFNDLRLVDNPDLVTKKYAYLTFGWFWNKNGLNALADKDQFTLVTQRINGARPPELTRIVEERLPNLRRANHTFY